MPGAAADEPDDQGAARGRKFLNFFKAVTMTAFFLFQYLLYVNLDVIISERKDCYIMKLLGKNTVIYTRAQRETAWEDENDEK